MPAHCPEQPVAVLASTGQAEHDNHTGHTLYQGGIVLVMLLFLLSFWSC